MASETRMQTGCRRYCRIHPAIPRQSRRRQSHKEEPWRPERLPVPSPASMDPAMSLSGKWNAGKLRSIRQSRTPGNEEPWIQGCGKKVQQETGIQAAREPDSGFRGARAPTIVPVRRDIGRNWGNIPSSSSAATIFPEWKSFMRSNPKGMRSWSAGIRSRGDPVPVTGKIGSQPPLFAGTGKAGIVPMARNIDREGRKSHPCLSGDRKRLFPEDAKYAGGPAGGTTDFVPQCPGEGMERGDEREAKQYRQADQCQGWRKSVRPAARAFGREHHCSFSARTRRD